MELVTSRLEVLPRSMSTASSESNGVSLKDITLTLIHHSTAVTTSLHISNLITTALSGYASLHVLHCVLSSTNLQYTCACKTHTHTHTHTHTFMLHMYMYTHMHCTRTHTHLNGPLELQGSWILWYTLVCRRWR